MVLYDKQFMRPENTFLDIVLKIYNTSSFEPYTPQFAEIYELTPSEKGYHYQQGQLNNSYRITDIISASWDNDYKDWSGSCAIKIPYRKKYLDLIVKGAYAEFYVNRLPEGADVEYLRRLDHEELKKAETQAEKKAEKKIDSTHLPRIYHPYTYPYIERSFRGFITDIKHNPDNMEITIKNYGVLLDESARLKFPNMYRSAILYEIIHAAGLVPNIDMKGLQDEVISWTNISSNPGSSTGESITGDDCTTTQSMSCLNGCGSNNHYGSGYNFDECCRKGYSKEGTEYYKWARQFSSGEDMLRKLRSIWTYSYYWNNRTCPQVLFNPSHWSSNCYDACRMVKVLCDSIGFPCVVVTGSAYGGGHGWNVVKVNGQWLSYDLCYGARANSSNSTNMSMLF